MSVRPGCDPTDIPHPRGESGAKLVSMNVTVFGTGPVGRSVATRLVELAHAVAVGSRDPDNPDGQAWLANVGTHRGAKLVGLAEAAAHGALLVNATSGPASITALELAGAHNLH